MCEGINSISFEQRTLKSRGDYERKALWSRVCVSRTPVFYLALSLRVSSPVFIHAQCTLMIDSRSHYTAIWQTSQESEGKRVPSVIRMSTCCFVCPGLHARYTDVFNVFLVSFLDVNPRGIPFSCTCRYTDG